ncbi:MAG: hypothetical protein ACXIUZ_09250 [Lysobacteraceae bacterium]
MFDLGHLDVVDRGKVDALRQALAHEPVVVFVGAALPGGVAVWVQMLLVAAGTVAGCALLHELLIRRVRWLRPLFGLPATPRQASATTPRAGAPSRARSDPAG